MRTPAPNEVHLHLTSPAWVQDDRLIAEYRSLLLPEERDRGDRFYFARDRHRHLVTRALVRTTLSRYGGLPPSEWQFVTNAYGRPQLAPSHAPLVAVEFNLSHTCDLVALAVTSGGAVGVDAEDAARHAPLEVADRYFSAREVRDLLALPIDHRAERFFDYWTLKESYIKARGMGLSIPLDQFTFDVTEERRIRFATEPSLEDDPATWWFGQYRTEPAVGGHVLALCVSTAAAPRPQVQCWRTVPLVSDVPCSLTPVRETHTGRPTLRSADVVEPARPSMK